MGSVTSSNHSPDNTAGPLRGMRSPHRIGKAIKDARTAAGLSQADVARESKIPRETISLLEGGKRTARMDTITAVLDVLGYEIAFLPRPAGSQLLRDLVNPTSRP